MRTTVRWHWVTEHRCVAQAGLAGTLSVHRDPGSYRWSMSALGIDRSGFTSIAAAKAAAVRVVRDQLVQVLLSLAQLEKDTNGPSASAGPQAPHPRAKVLTFPTADTCRGPEPRRGDDRAAPANLAPR
jgi:hypothetical protein